MYHFLCFPHVPSANQPTIMVIAVFQKYFRHPCSNRLFGRLLVRISVCVLLTWCKVAWCFSRNPDMSWQYHSDPLTNEYHFRVSLFRFKIFDINGAVRRRNIYWLKIKVIIKRLDLPITPAIRRDATVATVAKLRVGWQAEPPSNSQVDERLFCIPYRPDRFLARPTRC
jgi:hypothetical protein